MKEFESTPNKIKVIFFHYRGTSNNSIQIERAEIKMIKDKESNIEKPRLFYIIEATSKEVYDFINNEYLNGCFMTPEMMCSHARKIEALRAKTFIEFNKKGVPA